MKQVKKVTGLLLVLLLIVGLCLPQSYVQAETTSSSTVPVVCNGKTKIYKKKKTYLYINGKKVKVTKKPIFLKSGSYMGPAAAIFKSSSLKVTYTASSDHKTLVLKYNGHVLRMTNGSKDVLIDGKKDDFGTAPIYATYKATGKSYWIVPIKSVCSRLGITYKCKSNGVITLVGNNATTTTVSTQSTSTNTGKVVVVLDAGHGGTDSGAKGNGVVEKKLTLQIVLAAKAYFDKDKRFTVYYTRTGDTYPSLPDRCKLANNKNADLFVSVHINSGSSSSKTALGTETWYRANRVKATAKGNLNSKDLATYMQNYVLKATGFNNRGLVDDYRGLCVLRETQMPACLIEVGFLSKPMEALRMSLNTSNYGKAIYNGMVAYLKAKGRIK